MLSLTGTSSRPATEDTFTLRLHGGDVRIPVAAIRHLHDGPRVLLAVDAEALPAGHPMTQRPELWAGLGAVGVAFIGELVTTEPGGVPRARWFDNAEMMIEARK